jgi:hypothetical protein
LLATCSPALPCPALPCPALPCPALPCPALPCPALPCPALHHTPHPYGLLSTPSVPDYGWDWVGLCADPERFEFLRQVSEVQRYHCLKRFSFTQLGQSGWVLAMYTQCVCWRQHPDEQHMPKQM